MKRKSLIHKELKEASRYKRAAKIQRELKEAVERLKKLFEKGWSSDGEDEKQLQGVKKEDE